VRQDRQINRLLSYSLKVTLVWHDARDECLLVDSGKILGLLESLSK